MKQWYALRSKPKRETFAATLLTRAGISVYVPQMTVHRRNGKMSALEPFFPGYFFGHLDSQRAEIHLANYTPGVLYVVGYGDEATPIPDQFITSIQSRLELVRSQGELHGLRHGDEVEITSGPFKGLDAVFDCSLSPNGRVRVLIQILQRVCRAEVGVHQLRRANQAAGKVSA